MFGDTCWAALFFFCQPHLLHLLSSMCSSTEPEDPPCRILKGRLCSMWSTALSGFYQVMSISFVSFCLLTRSHSLSSSPKFCALSYLLCPASSILLVYSLSYLEASFQYFSGDFREMRSENLLGMQSCARNL